MQGRLYVKLINEIETLTGKHGNSVSRLQIVENGIDLFSLENLSISVDS
jgi:hypothetical protein